MSHPFIEAGGRDKATPRRPSAAKERFRRRAFDPRIDRLITDLDVLRPHRHKAPAHRLVDQAALLGHEHAGVLRRRDIPGRAQIWDGRVRQPVETDQLLPGEVLRKAPAHYRPARSSTSKMPKVLPSVSTK